MHRPPELAVDRFGDVAVIHTNAPLGSRASLRAQFELECPTAYVKIHPRRAQTYVGSSGPLWGPPREEVVVTEHRLKYLVKPAVGLTVGLFLDMREVRAWLLREAVLGKSVLNLFAYTCSLGVCAALGGASRVVNLDLSRAYLDWGKENYALNGLPVDDRDFIYGDAFDWLGRFARRAQRFDLVIVDPPSFSSTPFSVTRDYGRLTAAAAQVVSPSGVLLAATNHAATGDAQFNRWLRSGLAAVDRRASLLRQWHEPPEDFPVPPGGHPYLKVRALRLD